MQPHDSSSSGSLQLKGAPQFWVFLWGGAILVLMGLAYRAQYSIVLGAILLAVWSRITPRRLTVEANVLLVERWLWPKQSIPMPDILWAASTDSNSMDILHRDGLTTFWIGDGQEAAAWINFHARPPEWGANALALIRRRQLWTGFAGGVAGALLFAALQRALPGAFQGWAAALTVGAFSTLVTTWVIRRWFSRQR